MPFSLAQRAYFRQWRGNEKRGHNSTLGETVAYKHCITSKKYNDSFQERSGRIQVWPAPDKTQCNGTQFCIDQAGYRGCTFDVAQ